MPDTLSFRPRGHVRMFKVDAAEQPSVLVDKDNLVVDMSVEVMAQALLGGDQIDAILFGLSGGVVVTPGLRQVYNPVYRAPIGVASDVPPYLSKDAAGLKSVITWTGVYTNSTTSAVTYDMLGLMSQNDRMFAALSFDAVTIQPNESVAVEWTIILRGK